MARYRIVEDSAEKGGHWVLPEGAGIGFPIAAEALCEFAGAVQQHVHASPTFALATGSLDCQADGLDDVLITMMAPALDPLFASEGIQSR